MLTGELETFEVFFIFHGDLVNVVTLQRSLRPGLRHRKISLRGMA